jgi:hypothetical protein
MRGLPASALFATALASLALLSGCSSPAASDAPAAIDGALPAQEADAGETGEAGVTTEERQAGWTAGVNVAGVAPNLVGSGDPVEHIPGDGLAGVVVEMSWTASSQLSEAMTLTVVHEGETAGSVSGTSPLRLEFPGDRLAGDVVLSGQAEGPAGAYADQEYTVFVSSFHGVPFDPSFSAVPA